jgi:hypothetical protein
MHLNRVLSHHITIRLTGGAAFLLWSLTGIIWRNCFHGTQLHSCATAGLVASWYQAAGV